MNGKNIKIERKSKINSFFLLVFQKNGIKEIPQYLVSIEIETMTIDINPFPPRNQTQVEAIEVKALMFPADKFLLKGKEKIIRKMKNKVLMRGSLFFFPINKALTMTANVFNIALNWQIGNKRNIEKKRTAVGGYMKPLILYGSLPLIHSFVARIIKSMSSQPTIWVNP